MLEASLLRTFLAAVETGSLRSAADRVGRTQSAVTSQLQKLEALVGAPLLKRGARGVTPTAAGIRLIPAAKRALGDLEQALLAARGQFTGGELRLGIPEELARLHFVRAVSQFCTAFPEVQLSVFSGPAETFPRRLDTGELDLAVTFDEPGLPPGTFLANVPLVWAAAYGFDLAQRPLPLAVFDRACSWRGLAISALDRARIRWRLAVESQGTNGILAALEAGLAVALVDHLSRPDGLALASSTRELPEVRPVELRLHSPPEPSAAAAEMADALYGNFAETNPPSPSTDPGPNP